MAKQLSDIRNAVRDLLDELTAANWGDARLNVVINNRMQTVYTAQCDVEKDYNVKTSPILNGAISKQEYTISDGYPSDIYKIRRVEANYNVADAVNSVNQRCYPLHTIDAVRDRLNNTNVGLMTYVHPNYYSFNQNRIGFIPVFDRAATFQVWYYPVLPDLVNDSDLLGIWYPDRYFYLIVEGAGADALRFGQQESAEADKLDAKFIADIDTMKQEMNDPLAEEGRTVIDVTGDYLDFGHSY